MASDGSSHRRSAKLWGRDEKDKLFGAGKGGRVSGQKFPINRMKLTG
jgi:hypothetical protein